MWPEENGDQGGGVYKLFLMISDVIFTVGISDLAIAGIVVGVLAVVALLFCFIGLFFACSTSKVKEGTCLSLSDAMITPYQPLFFYFLHYLGIYGSSLSLQASSLPPGVSPHMQNHRTVSPPSSCLVSGL